MTRDVRWTLDAYDEDEISTKSAHAHPRTHKRMSLTPPGGPSKPPPPTKSLIPEDEVRAEVRKLPAHSFIRKYVTYGFNVTDAPLVFQVSGALTVLGAMAPTGLHIDGFGGPVHGNMFFMLVGASGDRKSTAIRINTRLMRAECSGLVGACPESSEAMVEALAEKAKQVFHYSEFGSFLERTAKDAHMSPLRMMLAQGFDGETISRRLVGKKVIIAPNPRLSVFAACNEPLLHAHTKMHDFDNGFLGRFHFVKATRERSYEGLGPRTDPVKYEELGTWIRENAARVMCAPAGFTPEAEVIWQAWIADLDTQRASHPMPSTFNRATEMAKRIMQLVAFDLGRGSEDGLTDWYLEETEVRFAIWYVGVHLRSAASIHQGLVHTFDMQKRKTVLNMITTETQPRWQLLSRSGMLKRAFDEIVTTLIEERKIETSAFSSTEAGLILWRERVAMSAAALMGEAEEEEEDTELPLPDNVTPIRKVMPFPGTALTLAQQAAAGPYVVGEPVPEEEHPTTPEGVPTTAAGAEELAERLREQEAAADRTTPDGDDLGEPDHSTVARYMLNTEE